MSKKAKRPAKEDPEVEVELPSTKRAKVSEIASSSNASISISTVSGKDLATVGEIMPAEARTAFDIQHAIEVAPNLLPQIGTCPLDVRSMLMDRCYMEPESVATWEQTKLRMTPSEYMKYASTLEDLERVQKAVVSMQDEYPLCAIASSAQTNKFGRIGHAIGTKKKKKGAEAKEESGKEDVDLTEEDCTVTLKLPALQRAMKKDESGESTFRLADFNKPFSSFGGTSDPAPSTLPPLSDAKKKQSEQRIMMRNLASDVDTSNSLLAHLYEIGATSPFGQVKTLKTVVDETVHRARQIDAENFSVSPAMIAKIEQIWAQEKFYPSNVTAVPYKIKLYDPEGMFKHHKDTPETGLVGTFLVGLTTTKSAATHLSLTTQPGTYSDTYWTATNGSWCAFYPDVVHQVLKSKVEWAHSDQKFATRGTIAFKIFAKTPQPSLSLHTATLNAFQGAHKPFGILLKHDYTVECKQGLLKGSDAALMEVLSGLDNCKIHLLPVLTSVFFAAEVGDFRSDESTKTDIVVYPFNEAMIQACLAPEEDPAGALLAISQWPDILRNISFITTRKWNDKVMSHSQDEGAEHTGNESRPAEQHSVYISAAIIVLPQ